MSDKNINILGRIPIQVNQRLVEAYYNRAIARGLSPYGVRKNLYCLMKLSGLIGKSFQKASEHDVERAMCFIETSSYASNTKNLYRATIKAFYGKADPRVSWIRVRGRMLKPKLPTELITRQELNHIISGTKSPKKRAMLAFLYDSAMRPKEFTALRRENVIPDGDGMYVVVPDVKTPPRTIYLTESRKYLDDVPFGCSYSSIANFFKRTSKKIHKRFYPYILRHSRITELSRNWSDAMLRKFAGWTQSSPMLQVYVHLGNNDLKEAMLNSQNHGNQQFISWEPRI